MTPWAVAYQAPPSMGFSRTEYWSGLSLASPGDLPEPGIKPGSPAWWVVSLPLKHLGSLTNKCFSIDYLMNEWDLCIEGFSGDSAVNNLPVSTGDEVYPCNMKIPWRRKWWPTPVFLPGKSHGQKSLLAYSPWVAKRIRYNLATSNNNWLLCSWLLIYVINWYLLLIL